ncbi:response regulator transcription factor [Ideonella azotifigens]|uniref:Response regulator n=1 Tax=Ideonella azotifigens TaxID=513160 RepID=A0ABP3V2H0_9BURK|nr:response regulator transcription factor [Ideonella azotifigens]MCD2341028.1 response regulator transcription factor [Ideonella azotifigens]
MLPKTLALVDDDREYSDGLTRYLREQGIVVSTFADSNDLLAHADPYMYDFYVTDLMLPGVDGTDLIKIIRQRTNAGVLVVSGRLAADTFKQVVTAGADMYLSKPVQFEQIVLAIEAVCRRSVAMDPAQNVWRLDRRVSQLIAPDGARVDLSDADCILIECFVEAQGKVVPRDTLLLQLGRAGDAEGFGSLNATVFRLRRRIERATPATVPLQTKSGVGYAFRALLKAI